ncbi:fungal-specific transcription factor domain-containing protein [Aspergillus karnatakaensis]|uniref:Zn(II)2Cys6 transcription factor n=1 Tax=Aspergillus karnatakaensis TaxID=1810916 RepID=UPI003CCCDA69
MSTTGHRTPEPDPEHHARPTTTGAATAEQACRECRRRKSKCDRTIPVCHLCGKFNRGCTYEKSTRTPLTRTYLSKVENELARTKALLKRFMSEDGVEGERRFDFGLGTDENEGEGEPAGTNGVAGSRNHATTAVTAQTGHTGPGVMHGSTILPPEPGPGSVPPAQVDPARGVIPFPTPLESQRALGSTAHLDSAPVGLSNPQRPLMRTFSESRSVGTTAFSLETPPSPSNFEWDERVGTAGGGKFVDGMASLTSRSNEGGYLGSASGAALLRLTDTRPADGNGIGPATYDSDAPVDYQSQMSIPFALTSMSQLEPFVDAYFRIYHCSYPIVHEATFRAQFMEIIPRPSGNAWQVLLFVISALGVFTSSTQPTDIDFALFDAAKERLSIDVLETGNLVLVQALTLISNYLQKRNKPNSGYNYMGLARRVAMGIGLHKEFPTWDATLLTLEMRRRVWYCLYIFDIGAIITFSRPLDFPEEGVDVQLPLNAHDSDITAATKRMPLATQETTIYTHLLAQAKFHLATSHIYSKIISHPLPSAAALIELDDQYIGGWLADLPPYFNETALQIPKFALCHAILRWRYRNFRILMYRPFLVGRIMSRTQHPNPTSNSNSGANDPHVAIAIDRCLSAAQEAVHLISTFWLLHSHQDPSQRNSMACWYALYFLFQAILIPVICLRNDPQSPLADGWRSQVLQAVEVLESMALLNPTAQRCLGVIRSLCGGYLQQSGIGEGWGQPTEESPQTQLANLYPLMWPTLEMGALEAGDSIIQESTIMDFMNRLPVIE